MDKCCIDQRTEESKQTGVAYLGDFLHDCDQMVVMLSSSYMKRLWCTYELAMFISNVLRDKANEDQMTEDKIFDVLYKKILFLGFDWPRSHNPIHWMKKVELSAEEQQMLSNYSCRECECAYPEDRELVLAEIRKHFGSEDKFDQFVREKLPRVLLNGKQRYIYRQTWENIIHTVLFLFADP